MMVAGRRNRIGRNVGIGAAIAALLIWSLVPVYWIIVTSLKHEQEIYAYPPTFIPLAPTLEQYEKILFHTPFPLFIRNSAIIALATTGCAMVAGTLAAYAISRMRFAGRAMVARLIVVSYLLPPSLLFIPLFIVLQRLGMIDRLGGLILAYLTFTMPFATWMLVGYIRTIPSELDEAARIDGASRLQVLWRILVPIALPALAVVALFAFTQAWNEFLYALVFIYNNGARTITAGLASLMMGDTFIWGQLMAASTLAIVPVLLIYLIAQRYLIEGLTGGSIK
jgi:ABC-type glycerol-3-phosphate transport system permease component